MASSRQKAKYVFRLSILREAQGIAQEYQFQKDYESCVYLYSFAVAIASFESTKL